MNRNIEVINENLWAVRFSLIPFIKEIEYSPDPNIPAYEEAARVTKGGLMILNKDHKGYRFLKDIMIKIMRKSEKKIKKELNKIEALKSNDNAQILYMFCLKSELERLENKKGGVCDGYDKVNGSITG